MRRLLLSLLLVSCTAMADDLSDADKFLAAKQYDKALSLYTKLAKAGNPEAQFRVGEMYWYGDGTAQDLEAARGWFEKAAAAGNPDARDSMAALERRKTRGNEISYWTKDYDGADLRSGQFECKLPVIPAASTTNADIQATRKNIELWQTCYGGFVANFNATAPLGKRIPADVLDMMTPQELELARVHVESVYGKVLARAQAEADTVRSQQMAWEGATERFVKEENVRVERQNEELKRAAVEAERRRQVEHAMRMERGTPSTTSSSSSRR
jgi:TPR repeat protein